MGHLFRFHPDTHTVSITHQLYVSYSLNTFDLGNDIDVEIVGQKCFIVTCVRADEAIDLQEAVLAFHGANTYGRNFGW